MSGGLAASKISGTAVTLAGTQTLTNKTLTSPVINVTSDATGDLYYRNAGGLFTRLGIGATSEVLRVTGGLPVWGAGFQSKTITATRDLAGATGAVSYTGVGFVPTSIICFANVTSQAYSSWGFTDSVRADRSGSNNGGSSGTVQANLVYINNGSGGAQGAVTTSFDADGFTLTWTKDGSPTGTINLVFICFR